MRGLVKDVGGKLLWGIERWIARSSTIGTTPFFDSSVFDWIPRLEAGWSEIRAELDGLLRHVDRIPNFQDISADQRSITTDDKWKTYFLYGFGYRAELNCERCPRTAELIGDIPGMQTAFFSILAPGKRIPEHRGLYKGLVRYHLAVKVPEPTAGCGIRVGDTVAHWEEGRSLLFDDTFPHEAWNDTEGVRVVLFMDIVRPLRPPASWLNRAVLAAVRHTPYVQDARRNQEDWERRLAAPGASA